MERNVISVHGIRINSEIGAAYAYSLYSYAQLQIAIDGGFFCCSSPYRFYYGQIKMM